MFLEVDSADEIEVTATIAKEIWNQHFTPLIGIDQVNYMLDNFQSIGAITKQIRNEGYSYFLVLDQKVPIGYFAFYLKEDFLYISKLYLKKSARGKGYSRIILSFIENKASSNGAKFIKLNVFKGNDHTISVYKRMGFEVIDQPQIDIGNGFILDDYVMRKSLK